MNGKDIVKRKKEGASAVTQLLPLLLVVMTILILFMWLTGWIRNFETRNDIEVIGRKYIEKMETYGYMTNEMKQSMQEELVQVGVKADSISFAGTTLDPASYGADIDLRVTGNVLYRTFKSTNLDLEDTSHLERFSISKSSTCKR